MNESLSVLIVDDDVSIQNVVEEILSDGGFEPKAASSVEEAIALLNAHRFRAVIIDISFGKDHVKGWAVARRARAFNPALPIIYITGGNTDEWAIQGVPNSILITKPFPPAQLLTAVSQLLTTGTPQVTGLLKGGLLCGALARPPHSSYDGSGQPRRDSRTISIRAHFSQRYRRSSFPVSSGSLPSIFIVCLQSMQVIKSSNRFRSSFMCSATATCASSFSRRRTGNHL